MKKKILAASALAVALLLSVPVFSATTWYAALPSTISCSVSNGSPIITATNSFVAGDVVYFTVVQTPWATSTAYYVISAGLSGSQFETSTTYGGSAISATATGGMTAQPQSVDLIVWKSTQGASCANSGSTLTWPPANGDTLNNNGCTNLYITANPGSGSVYVSLVSDATNTGGGFVYPTGANATLDVQNITSTASTALTITGSTGGLTLQCGSAGTGTITGGSTTTIYGVSDGHTSVSVVVNCYVSGGSNTTTYGYYATSTGPGTITGNVQAGTATSAWGFNSGSSGTWTINGNCTGSDSYAAVGCGGTSNTVLTVVGSLFYGKKGAAVSGPFYWQPGGTNCITISYSSSGSLQTSCGSGIVSYVTQVVPALSSTIGTTSNVKTAIAYGGFTGTLSPTGGQHNTGYVQ